MKPQVFACVLAVFAAGCSTIKPDMAFDGSAPQAFVLLAADGMTVNGSQSYSFALQKMDVGQKVFLPEISSVNFSGLGTIEGDEFKKPQQLHTTFRFGGEPLASGEYALISRVDTTAAGMATNTHVNCFSEGAPVYRIRQGHINIVPADNVRGIVESTDRALLQSQVATVLAGYPNISAPVAFAELVGIATFETAGKNLLGVEVCKGAMVNSFIIPGD